MAFDAPVDRQRHSTRDVVGRVEQAVQLRTTGMIRGLRVDLVMGEVVISGRAPTYYAKQLATQAALECCSQFTLTNDIEVL